MTAAAVGCCILLLLLLEGNVNRQYVVNSEVPYNSSRAVISR